MRVRVAAGRTNRLTQTEPKTNPLRLLASLLLTVVPWFAHAADVGERSAVIVSEGVRLHAGVYCPRSASSPLPTIDWFDQHLKK